MKTGRGLHSYMTLLLGLLNAFFWYWLFCTGKCDAVCIYSYIYYWCELHCVMTMWLSEKWWQTAGWCRCQARLLYQPSLKTLHRSVPRQCYCLSRTVLSSEILNKSFKFNDVLIPLCYPRVCIRELHGIRMMLQIPWECHGEGSDVWESREDRNRYHETWQGCEWKPDMKMQDAAFAEPPVAKICQQVFWIASPW